MLPRRRLAGAGAAALALALPAPAIAGFGDADPTFGVRGSVPLALPSQGLVTQDQPTLASLERLADGRLQVIGAVGDGRRAVLARLRYTPAGGRIAGAEGAALSAIGNGGFGVYASAPLPGGGVLVVGTTHTGDGTRPVVVRLTPGGALDARYGAGGLALLPGLAGHLEPGDVAVDGRGRALVLGTLDGDDGATSSVLVRFTQAGLLDRSYDRDGVVAIRLGPGSDPESLALEVAGDGTATVLALGPDPAPGVNAYVYLRRTPTGAADARFGSGGTVRATPVGASQFLPAELALAPDGSLHVVGTAVDGASRRDAATLRLLPDGRLDAAYALRTLVGAGSTGGRGLAIRRAPDGTLAILGRGTYAADPTSRNLVARLAADGTPVAGFGTAGVAVIAPAVAISARAIDVAGGGAVIGGRSTTGLALLRLDATGALVSDGRDAAGGFTERGIMDGAIAAQPGGAILARTRLETPGRLALLDRLGRPVRSFGAPLLPGGVVIDSLPSARIESTVPLAGGGLLVVGTTTTAGFVQARRADGSLDPAFGGGDGQVDLPAGTFASRALVLGDGSVMVAGSSFVGVDRGLMLARLTPGGALDPLFGGGDGIVEMPYLIGTFDTGLPPGARAVTALPGGGFLVISTSESLAHVYSVVLARVTAAGTADSTFGPGGVRAVVDPQGLVFTTTTDRAGRILISGLSGDDAFVLRLLPDGRSDASFGTNGVVRLAPARGSLRVDGSATYPDGSVALHVQSLPNGMGIALHRLVLLDARGRQRSARRIGLDGEVDPVVLPDGRLLLADAHRAQLGSEGRIARVLGPPPLRPLGVRRVSRSTRGFVLSARVDARGLTGVSLQLEVRRRGRFVRVGRVAVAATVGSRRVAVRARGLAAGRRYTARLVLVSANGRAATPSATVRTRG